MCVVAPTEMVINELPEPGAGMVTGLKFTVVPVGMPVAERLTELLKPLLIVVVIVELPCMPCITLMEPGDAVTEKPGAPPTVRVTVVVC